MEPLLCNMMRLETVMPCRKSWCRVPGDCAGCGRPANALYRVLFGACGIAGILVHGDACGPAQIVWDCALAGCRTNRDIGVRIPARGESVAERQGDGDGLAVVALCCASRWHRGCAATSSPRFRWRRRLAPHGTGVCSLPVPVGCNGLGAGCVPRPQGSAPTD